MELKKLESLCKIPKHIDRNVKECNYFMSDNLKKYSDYDMSGYAILYRGKLYVTYGVIYKSNEKSRQFIDSQGFFEEAIGGMDFPEYKFEYTITTSYGTQLDVYKLTI